MIDLNDKSELNLLPSQEHESKHVSKKKRWNAINAIIR